MKVSCAVALLLVAVDVALAADSSSGSGSTIIYVVIGVVVLLFLLAALFVWKRKQNRREDGPAQLEAGDGVPNVRRGNAYDIHHSPAAPHQEPQRHPYSNGIDDRRDGRHRPQGGHMRQERPFNGERQDRSVPPRPVFNVDRQKQYQQPQPPNREVNQERNHHPVRSEPVPHPPPPPRSNVSEGNARSREVAARVLAEFQADPSLGRRRIPYSALYFTRVLSKGAFGEVWLAQLENKQVAVKRILNEKKNDEKEIECFAAEIKLMASFYHPKIVEFVGVSWSTLQDLCAVTEYMAKGDLYGFLKRKNGQLNWRDHKAYLAEDVAEALGYLHSLSPKVIHRDLKSKNILLDDSFRAKLSDFGISRERSLEETMTAGVGTIYWTAPEVLMGKKYTEKADIYSFGIVMSELDTHEVPYSDKRDEAGKKLQGMKIVQMVIKKKLRPSFSASCPEIVHDLAMRCLDADPDVRPDANELRAIIQRIQNQL